MAEWSNAVDSKSIVRVSVPGVQIPLSPPMFNPESELSPKSWTVQQGAGFFLCEEAVSSVADACFQRTGLSAWASRLALDILRYIQARQDVPKSLQTKMPY